MKRVLINIAGWIALPFLFLWLLCCSGCAPIYWSNLEGDQFLSVPVMNSDYDTPQVQLNRTHYK